MTRKSREAQLGAGTPTNSGEDLDMFLRVLLAGRAIAYESSAVIWHVHRSDSEALGRQMYNYGLGLTAYLAKHMLDSSTRWQMLRRVPRGAKRLIYLWSRARTGGPSAGSCQRRVYRCRTARDDCGPVRVLAISTLGAGVPG
jgi:GT2 family glycosyltransferase